VFFITQNFFHKFKENVGLKRHFPRIVYGGPYVKSHGFNRVCHPPVKHKGGRSFEAFATYPHLDSNRCVAFDTS
ncbi:MAG: hypothetical protein J5666_08450, partial [Bacilli bacterium]|nr:hypothetical protein [Bacilli bacterium]